METLVDLELAKRLKSEGYWRPCEYFYQDKELPFCASGLKKTKNGELMNHNQYDNFIYSAPTLKEGVDYLLGKNIKYKSSIVIKLGGSGSACYLTAGCMASKPCTKLK